MICHSIFRYVFQSLSQQIWKHVGSQTEPKINKKSIKNSIEVLGLGVPWTPFWELWGSILGAEIINFRSLEGPWNPDGLETEKKSKKEPKNSNGSFILETVLASFFGDFSEYFLVRFLDHFFINL